MQPTIIILTCVIIIGCNSNPSTDKSLTLDEYNVYSAIINDKFKRYNEYFNKEWNDTIHYVVVYNQTINSSILASLDSNISFLKYITAPELYELALALSTGSKDSCEIDPHKIAAPVKMISKETINERWRYYYTQGTNVFSRVGFNSDRTKALVYNQVWTEWGLELMYLLKKENGKWLVIDGLKHSAGYELLSKPRNVGKPLVGKSSPIPNAVLNYVDSTAENN